VGCREQKPGLEDREKYRVGGLAVTAGLNAWTDEELKAAFASLVASGPKPAAKNGAEAAAEIPAGTKHAGADERLL